MARPITHGQSYTATYQAWVSMKVRCDNLAHKSYPDYGGRGITYTPSWKSFEAFLVDMGERPEHVDVWSLERIDNNQGYFKENCKWASPSEQRANRRVSKQQINNTSGITGVYWHKDRNVWTASYQLAGKQIRLYRGTDFFEACCRRKSWEAQQKAAA